MKSALIVISLILSSCAPAFKAVDTKRSLDFPIGIKEKVVLRVLTDADLDHSFPTPVQSRCKSILEQGLVAKGWKVAGAGQKFSHILSYGWSMESPSTTGYTRIGDSLFEDKIYVQTGTAYVMTFGSKSPLWRAFYTKASYRIDLDGNAIEGAERIALAFPDE